MFFRVLQSDDQETFHVIGRSYHNEELLLMEEAGAAAPLQRLTKAERDCHPRLPFPWNCNCS